jgi:hypothetical protein
MFYDEDPKKKCLVLSDRLSRCLVAVSPWYTAFLPIRIPPIGNGKRFQKSGRGYILSFVDDEDDEEDIV